MTIPANPTGSIVLPAFPTSPAYPLMPLAVPPAASGDPQVIFNFDVLGGSDVYVSVPVFNTDGNIILIDPGATNIRSNPDYPDYSNIPFNVNTYDKTYAHIPGTFTNKVLKYDSYYTTYGLATANKYMSYLSALCDCAYNYTIFPQAQEYIQVVDDILNDATGSTRSGEPEHTVYYTSPYGTSPTMSSKPTTTSERTAAATSYAATMQAITTWYASHLRDLMLGNITRTSAYAQYAALYSNILIFNGLVAQFNFLMGTNVVQPYMAQRAALAANPAMQNPYGYLLTQEAFYAAFITSQVAAAQAAINGVVLAATTIVNGIKTGTVDPTILTVTNTIAAQQTFVLATIASATAQANTAVASAQATVNAQVAILQAQVAAQQAAAQATITSTQAQAMAQIASAQATALAAVANTQAQIAAVTAQGLAVVLTQVAALQAQLADRPLYYGALATPITITSSTDVVVIPSGGLTLTAD